jgi:hypothetical protein
MALVLRNPQWCCTMGAIPSFLERFRRAPVPTDARTAEELLKLAEVFVADVAEVGEAFTWESAEASRLDGLCDALLATRPSPDRQYAWIMGAYLGELLVRHGGGRWSYDKRTDAAVVEMPNGLNGYPHNKVAKRLEIGAEHNLFQFYWYALTRDTPPGSQVTYTPG